MVVNCDAGQKGLSRRRVFHLMGQTEEIKMMSRPNRFTYTPITRGHKPTASQESNTLSTMSEVGLFLIALNQPNDNCPNPR